MAASQHKSTSASSQTQLIATLSVSAVTTAISVVNKLAVRDYPYSSTISFIQALFILIGISAYWLCFSTLSQISLRKAQQFFPTALATSGNFITNFKALKYLNVSTLSVMHNANLILVAASDYLLFGRRFKNSTLLSLVVILIGAVMYGYGEIQVSLIGYTWMFLHMIAHESQSLYTKYITMVADFTSVEMSFYNAVWSCPILFASLLLSHEQTQSFSKAFTPDAFWVCRFPFFLHWIATVFLRLLRRRM
jgi:drug/metabolite transporter (DMT)-like permease